MAIDGDKTTTGATCIASSSMIKYKGTPAVIVGDLTTTCPQCKQTGTIATGDSRMMNNRKPQAVDGSIVQCGCPYGSNTIIAKASPANATSLTDVRAFSESKSHTGYAGTRKLPAYLTGEKTELGFIPDYPVLRNSMVFPDQRLRGMLYQNNFDVMLLTVSEVFEVLQSWGWKDTKTAWVEITQSGIGQVMVNYGVNGKDVVTTSMILVKLGDLGIRATVYINHIGTELIKFTGYPGIRKILNAPVFRLDNTRVVDLGIGKYGLTKSIIEGARLTFYVAAAYRTLDYILNDETSLAKFIGSLSTDIVKLGIASAISWGAATAITTLTAVVSVPLIVVVAFGLLSAIALNMLDDKFGVTDKVVAYLEASQQEFVQKAREIEKGIYDIGAMYADKMLETGKEVLEREVKRYIKKSLKDIKPRIL
ncbi:PAAR domain-containing protein [Morganella morganii]|uniref:PAAR domain-containing protein n=1 Tax=Morganella morganii TaxID=582 RepID=UPI0021CF64C7|nr:PAAR domain-containing protein [Morganella morganii]